MTAPLTRHFVYVDGQRLHYRRCGEGPVVVLFHASPVSSRVHEPLMRFLSGRFTTIAFDTPSNGLSEPLNLEQPTIEDYADIMAEALKQLGVQDCAAYGRHTGASIAVELANRHPDLTTMALTDGYPNFTDEQREKYLSGYLSDLPLDWSGSHLLWLWFRYRDQHVFWPWNAMDADHRADTDVPDNAFVQRGIIELLEAGNNYKAPYVAAFLHRALPPLETSKRPICVAARPGDSLFYALKTFPESAWLEEMPREAEAAMAKELEVLEQHAPAHAAPDIVPGGTASNGLTWGYRDAGGQQLFTLSGGEGPPLIFLPSLPGAIEAYVEQLEALSSSFHVVAIDLLGCGNSDELDPGTTLQQLGEVLNQALPDIDTTEATVVAVGGACLLVPSLTEASPRALHLIDPVLLSTEQKSELPEPYAPDCAPADHGEHLTKLWHHVRDQRLWFPWNERTRAASKPRPDVSEADLQRQVRHLVKHASDYQPLWQTVIDGAVETIPASLADAVTVWCSDTAVVPAGHMNLDGVHVQSRTTVDAILAEIGAG